MHCLGILLAAPAMAEGDIDSIWIWSAGWQEHRWLFWNKESEEDNKRGELNEDKLKQSYKKLMGKRIRDSEERMECV